MLTKKTLGARPLTWVVRRCLGTRAARNDVSELLGRTRAAGPSQRERGAVADETVDDGWTTRHWYPDASDPKRCQARKGASVNPERTSVVLFTGEAGAGAGSVSARDRHAMSSRLSAKGRDMMLAASDTVKRDLEAELAQSSGSVSHAAVLVRSLAAAEDMPEAETCVACAGFGLGELTALVFAGSLDLFTAVRLAEAREEALRQLAAEEPSGLLAVAYGADSKLGQACAVAQKVAEKLGRRGAWCGVAAYLHPHCKIVGGHEEALSFLEKNGADFNLRACRRLPVPAAWYTPIMKPVVPIFRQALADIDIKPPRISVYSACRKGKSQATRYTTESNIRLKLADQLAAAIQWEQTVHAIYERKRGTDFPRSYICGPGGAELGEVVRLVNAKAADRLRALV